MLIDNSHRRWFVGTAFTAVLALGVYLFFYRLSPNGLTGGSRLGMVYGIIGSLLMVFAGLLSAHRRLPRFPWLPRRSWMLKGHIWLGLLCFLFILCHSGFSWGGTLEILLWLVLGLVILSGVVGLVLQNTIPRFLSLQIAEETPYEQMPHVCRLIVQKADSILDDLCGPVLIGAGGPLVATGNGLSADMKIELRQYYEGEIRPYLLRPALHASQRHSFWQPEEAFSRLHAIPGLADARSELRELETLCLQRRQIARQERMYHLLHAWLVVHIPLSVVLLVLGIAHAVMTVYY